MPYDNEKDRLRRLNYQRNYNREHKEELSQKHREYYQKNREKILEQCVKYHQKNKAKRNEQTREWKRKLREQLKLEIGSICAICSEIPKIPIYHKKDFKSHIGLKSEHSGESNPKYILDNSKDFIPLCRNCHKTIHRFKRYQKEFERLLN